MGSHRDLNFDLDDVVVGWKNSNGSIPFGLVKCTVVCKGRNSKLYRSPSRFSIEIMDSPASVKTSNIFSPPNSGERTMCTGPRYRIISIEGNIGSGKTTLLANIRQHLEDRTDVVFLKEPVDIWETIRDSNGQTMLQKFYADQEKYSFPFQMMAYITRLTILRDAIRANPTALIVTERSLYVRSKFYTSIPILRLPSNFVDR